MSTRIVYGVRAIEELCRARPRDVSVIYIAEGKRNPDIDRMIATAKDRAIAVETRPRSLIADLAESGAHQGVVAVAGAYPYASVDDMLAFAAERGEAPLLLLLDGITDPQNMGALVRSGEVLGAHGVIAAEKESAPVGPGAVKASAGATERTRIARVPNLLKTIDDLRARGLGVWGTAAGGEATPLPDIDLRGPVALVIGSEGRGLREAVARRCTGALTIPMIGEVASLNASAAGAIALYEAARQRRSAAP